MAMAMKLEDKVFHENEGAVVRGEYSRPDGPRKFLGSRYDQEDIDYYSAEEVEALIEAADAELVSALGEACSISVNEADTYLVALELAAQHDEGEMPVLVLNFANAFWAAGNRFISKFAQEGELCRRSTLYASLLSDEAHPFYDANTENSHGLYTNGVLVSPHVEVFRTPDYLTMPDPVRVAVISSPAPFKNDLADMPEDELSDVLKTRIQGILAIAAKAGYKHLVLGAWGCGSNGNDPAQVASAFRAALDTPLAGSTFANLFDTVTFAVLDYAEGQPSLSAFRSEFDA